MTSKPAAPDPTMEAISRAIELGRAGDVDTARRQLVDLWQEVGSSGDPFHRCTLAHYLADLYNHPAEALIWDIRALDAAASLSDERAQAHHQSLQVDGFYPSLHLNIADNLRLLSAFDAAAKHICAAEERSEVLSDDGYARMTRTAIVEVRAAIDRRETARRDSAPGGS
ncbi:hypothetical protein [Brevibacterium sp. 1718]|uniref:hypothetical protein n=1 Tax=Brevibacterium sp. 1718 TaxID=3413510 RepID=UPI003DA7C2FD